VAVVVNTASCRCVARDTLVLLLLLQAHPERDRFAWVDAAFNAYRVLKKRPARPPPWQSFWPERGLAVRMHAGACHNEPVRPGVNHSSCPVATFLWGTRDSWHAFNLRYLERVRELVTAEPPPQGMLCTEQDLWADVLARHNVDGHLATEFTTSDAGGWGWQRAEPVSVTCGDGKVNIGNRCVRCGPSEGLACKPVSAAPGAVNKRSG
jgi:hypothetical protein